MAVVALQVGGEVRCSACSARMVPMIGQNVEKPLAVLWWVCSRTKTCGGASEPVPIPAKWGSPWKF